MDARRFWGGPSAQALLWVHRVHPTPTVEFQALVYICTPKTKKTKKTKKTQKTKKTMISDTMGPVLAV